MISIAFLHLPGMGLALSEYKQWWIWENTMGLS